MKQYRNFSTLISLFIFSSCITLFKTITGFENPKVITREEVLELKESIFEPSENVHDLYFSNSKESAEIYEIISYAFSGQLEIFDKNGNRKCLPETNSCSATQFAILQSQKEEGLIDCTENNSKSLSPFTDLAQLLKKTKTIEGKELTLDKIPETDFYLVYSWADFMMKSKRQREDFEWFVSRIEKLDKKYTIIRVNCDPLDEWGLKKGKKVKIEFHKRENSSYEINFGELPFQ